MLHKQERDITAILTHADRQLDLQPPGADPISGDATPRFRHKIQQIKDVHWAHVHELHEATERLREAARHYGWTEEQIDDSFKAHDDSVGPIVNR